MELFFRKLGNEGKPVIILHGLYGSSDNWYSIGRELATNYKVHLIDHRNHGNSPHSPEHNYNALTGDLYLFMQKHHIDQAFIIGHSMGGKAALDFGMKHPEKVLKMIVVDISPIAYDTENLPSADSYHMKIISALNNINTDTITNRDEADRQLKNEIPSPSVRQFLLKNLKRTPEGKFRWAMNIKSLSQNMKAIFEGVIHNEETDPRAIPEFPLLFIKGGRSDYIRERDEMAIHHYFPWAEIKVISDAGHWIHAEQPREFLELVKNFLA